MERFCLIERNIFACATTYHSEPVIMNWMMMSFAYCLPRAWVFSGLLNSNHFSIFVLLLGTEMQSCFQSGESLYLGTFLFAFRMIFELFPFLWYLLNLVNNNHIVFNILFPNSFWSYISWFLSKNQNTIKCFIPDTMDTFLGFFVYVILEPSIYLGYVVSAPSHNNLHDIMNSLYWWISPFALFF